MANFKKTDSKQLRPGLWATVNERYPGSMITKTDFVPLARLHKPLGESRLTFVSTAGVNTAVTEAPAADSNTATVVNTTVENSSNTAANANAAGGNQNK